MNLHSRAALVLSLWCLGPIGMAQDFDHGPVFSVLEENDLIVDTDRHYTQGIRVSFLTADNSVPGFVKDVSDFIPAAGYEAKAVRTGVVIGQSIFTPSDLQSTELITTDRPYAGWLYIGLPLQRRGLMGERWVTLESFQVDMGVIGRQSLAQDAQTWVHRVRGFDLPQGWDNQLETEPGIALKYQRSMRFTPKDLERNLDFIPHVGGSLGNVETSLRTGLGVRTGINLPDDFGVQTISSLVTSEGGATANDRWFAYVFGSVEGWLVGYTTFLDGNIYHSSHSVDRIWGVVECKGGAAVGMRWAELALTLVYRTREFSGQEHDNSYGSVSFKVKF